MADNRSAGTRLRFESPIERVAGIGPKRARALRELEINTVRDLVCRMPIGWEDLRHVTPLSALSSELDAVTVKVRLRGVRCSRFGRRRVVCRGELIDETGRLPAVWFNRPHLDRQVRSDIEYLVHGPLRQRADGTLELVNPSLEPDGEQTRRLKPIYARLGPLGAATVASVIRSAVRDLEAADPLPTWVLERRELPPLPEALAALHLPDGEAEPEQLAEIRERARCRLAYGELLQLQLALIERRSRSDRVTKPHRYVLDDGLCGTVRSMLPFRLTGAQRRAAAAIAADLQRRSPMRRLLQGDVGCGKTVVAALAILLAVRNGVQAALMAPTEILAEQHSRSLRALFRGVARVDLLTSSAPTREQALARLQAGTAEIVVGTQALLEQPVSFEHLGLVVIDEQHRFGVEQRSRLPDKGLHVDLLVMSATPIPRSLTLALYGDLDLSVIDELPPGRSSVETELLPDCRRELVVERIRDHLDGGGQCYVVCPLIDESDTIAAGSVAELGARYLEAIGRHRGAVITGRSPRAEREAVMEQFRAGELSTLISTTVIEVGVDVPNASVMVIESAERFGLAQLHQLRGRIGRGQRASVCLAIHSEELTDIARRRLEVFERCSDGFQVAEADLEIRGPGDLFGTRQAGTPSLTVADPVRDLVWLEAAREDVRAFAREDVRAFAREDVRASVAEPS